MDKEKYGRLVTSISPKSHKFKDFFAAFLVGGLICALGEVLYYTFNLYGVSEQESRIFASVTLVLFAIIMTALGVFDKIAKFAGAGTLVPITGFANAVASPAIEFKSEGYVLGLGVNMFKIAGPVIVYGTVASVIYGVIYWIYKMI